MFSQKLTLSDSTSPTPVTTDVELTAPIGVNNANNKSQRSASSVALDEPFVVTIGHETSGKNNKKVDRHLVRLDMTKSVTPEGSSTPVLATVSAYAVLIVPIGSIISKADVKFALENLTNLLVASDNTVTVLDRLLNNEL